MCLSAISSVSANSQRFYNGLRYVLHGFPFWSVTRVVISIKSISDGLSYASRGGSSASQRLRSTSTYYLIRQWAETTVTGLPRVIKEHYRQMGEARYILIFVLKS